MLYPAFETTWVQGREKVADVTVNPGDDGEPAVETGGGTSLFDARVFKGKNWLYFEIPPGTDIPDSLNLNGPEYRSGYKANHYLIEPLNRMRVDAYKGALDNFARNAIVRACALARGEGKVNA